MAGSATDLNSYRRRAVLAGVAAAGLVATVLAFDLWRTREQAIGAAMRETMNLTRAFEEHTVRTIQSVDRTLIVLGDTLIGERPEAPLAADAIEAELRRRLEGFPQVQSYFLINPDGRVRASSRGPGSRGVDLSDRDYVAAHRTGPDTGLYIGGPLRGRVAGEWFIALSRAIHSADGRLLGIIEAGVDPSYFADVYRSIDVGRGGVTLSTRDHVIVARHPNHLEFIGRSIAGGVVALAAEQAPYGPYRGATANNRIDRLGYFRSIPGTPLVINVGYATNDVLAEWWRSTWIEAGIGGTLMALIAFSVFSSIRGRERLAALAESQAAQEAAARERERVELAARAKSAFLANMSHDLRTPLNAILGFTQMIQMGMAGGPSSDRRSEYEGFIEQSARHLLNLVDDFLDLSAIEAGKLRLREAAVEVGPLAQECTNIARGMAAVSDVSVDLRLPDTPVVLKADPLRLKQILLNVLSNAVKFTPAQGRISLAVADEGEAGVAITIRDTGIGMSPAEVRVALEPWQQLESTITRRFEGTGLGLPLVRALVEMHGGSLAIESAPQRGTAVVIQLPPERLLRAA